ncbi:hypothetical protein FRB99_007739 [Tulasnella sp. 403]|nr:hypothetical protein FRB99_007739 [Tulasnella sp. 403]
MNSYIPLATRPDGEDDPVPMQPSTEGRRFLNPGKFLMGTYLMVVLVVGVAFGLSYGPTGWTAGAFSLGGGATSSVSLPGGFHPLKDGVDGPGNSLRDNLLPNVSYVTAWAGAGMTNVVMDYCNLIFVGLRTNRVPIVPPLVPDQSHLDPDKISANPWINTSEIFDIERLSRALDWPVIEWAQVKKAPYGRPFNLKEPVEGQVLDKIGCWSTNQIQKDHGPRRSMTERFLNLDISYTPIPTKFAIPDTKNWYSFWGVADLLYPLGRSEALALPDGKPGPSDLKTVLPPDEQVACFDDLYYAAAVRAYEWGKDVSPAWRYVGVHLHFTERVENLAMGMLRRAVGIPEREPIPPYLALHIRRSDFKLRCKGSKVEGHEECFPPLSVYDKHLKEVREKLRDKFGGGDPRGNPLYVIATSDERDPQWWEKVREMGWFFIDHGAEQTSKRLGKWYVSAIGSVTD